MGRRVLILAALVAGCGSSDPVPISALADVAGSEVGVVREHADAATSPADVGLDVTADTAADVDDTRDMAADLAVDDGSAQRDMSADDGPDLASPSDDPFDPGSCSGAAWEAQAALGRLAASDAEILDAAVVMQRTRQCDAAGCGPWSAPVETEISFLTWSGGVSTRYKTLRIDTSLVLWNDAGDPKLSVRHDTHVAQYPDDHAEGITFGFPPQVVAYPYIRAWNVAPENQYDYRDLEQYLGRDATLFASPTCARFVSVLPESGAPETTQFAALFRF